MNGIDAARHVTSPRRGLSRREAAVYVGVSPTTFDKLVSEHSMPSPLRIRARRVWDMRALDLAFDAISGEDDDAAADPTWSDVDAFTQAPAAR